MQHLQKISFGPNKRPQLQLDSTRQVEHFDVFRRKLQKLQNLLVGRFNITFFESEQCR